jgi:DNA primase
MDSIKDLVRDKMRIEDVIGTYVTLVPFGRNYKACCPFHQEKTPSFNINTEKQMFYCFGCKKGGDVFSFIQEIERLDFRESLKFLAEKAGIDMNQSKELSLEMRQKKALLQIHEYATRFYQILLTQHPTVLEYLKKRGLLSETIKTWRIGYAPDGFQQLVNVLRSKGFSDSDLIASGLVGKSDRGLYDRFRGRIMFPITDNQGKIIAFSGRVMPGTQEASRDTGKYINSPETIIYHKSSALFGFSQAKKSIADQKSVLIVEGQFDTILLHQSGYTNTIALSGTACTEKHMEQLRRFADELVIATDNDRAGIQSAYKIAELGYQFDCDVSVVQLPEGKDPADMILENAELWKQYVSDKKGYLEFHNISTEHESLRDRIGAVEKNIFPILVRVSNNVKRDVYLQSVAETLHVSSDSIRKEFQKFLQNYQKDTTGFNYQSSSIATKVVSVHNPLTVQIHELAAIRESFSLETNFWFINNPESLELLKKESISVPTDIQAEILVRYQSLDNAAWKIRLDTLWIRIQQILLDTKMDELRQVIKSSSENEVIQKLQIELMTLHAQKESLIRSLAE